MPTPELVQCRISFSSQIATRNVELLDILDVWTACRHGRSMPARWDLSPETIRRHLGWVHLLDVSSEPLDFRFRLYGSKIAEVLGHDATGKTLSEAFSEPFLSEVRGAFEYTVESAAPLLLFSSGAGADKDFLTVTSLLLPLSDIDDTVDVILVRHVIGDE